MSKPTDAEIAWLIKTYTETARQMPVSIWDLIDMDYEEWEERTDAVIEWSREQET